MSELYEGPEVGVAYFHLGRGWITVEQMTRLEALADLARRASEPLYLRRNVGGFLSDHDLAWLRDYEAVNSNVNVST